MKKRLFSALLALVMALALVPAMTPVAEAAGDIVSRDDGVWLFPLPSTYYHRFTDWAACPGNGTCAFHNTTHPEWGDSAHTNDPYGHAGFDVGAESGTDVYVAASGTIIYSGTQGARGNVIVVEHTISGTGYSYYSIYQHLSAFVKTSGSSVSAGETIGRVGSTGQSSGSHLHFEIYRGSSGLGGTTVLGNAWNSDWLRSESDTVGRVLVNPSVSSEVGLPQGYVTGGLTAHSGSVRYTFTASNVKIGGSGPDIDYYDIADGTYYIKSVSTGYWLTLSSGGDTNGANIEVCSSFGGDSIKMVTTKSGDVYKLRPASVPSRVVNTYTAEVVSSGCNVTLWDDTGHNSQRWRFEKVSGGFVIRNQQAPSCVLNVDGANVNVLTYTGANSQKWLIQNSVDFDANGGSGAPGTQMKNYGETLTLSTSTPTRSGYTFKGWATSSSATSAQYQAGGSYTANSNVTLYAVWSKNPITYTVSYNANGGSGAPASQTKTENVNLTLSSTVPTRSGYTFKGWATSSTATSAQYQPGGTYAANASVTLYAVWQLSSVTITIQPESQTAVEDSTVNFTVKASNATGYQWYYRTSSTGTWNACSGTGYNTATLTVEAKAYRNGYQYRCMVSNAAGSVYSSVATLTVISKPTITTQPKSQTAAEGTTVKFTVNASNATAYQWYYRTSSTGTWKKFDGGTSSTLALNVKSYRDGYQYRCKVSNAVGYVFSSTATLTVISYPTITTQPKSQTAAEGTTVKFTVKATGATAYQWYYRTSSTGTWKKFDGGTSSTLALNVKAYRNGYQYRCKVSNAAGSVYSSAATLTVTSSGAPTITTQPISKTAYEDDIVKFKVVASGENLTYQWYYRVSSTGNWVKCSGTGCNTATLTVEAKAYRNGYQYRCKVSNDAGYVYSSVATLTVK